MILRSISGRYCFLNFFFEEFSRKERKVFLMLKLNVRILKEFGFIDYGIKENFRFVRFIEYGRMIFSFLEVDGYE